MTRGMIDAAEKCLSRGELEKVTPFFEVPAVTWSKKKNYCIDQYSFSRVKVLKEKFTFPMPFYFNKT